MIDQFELLRLPVRLGRLIGGHDCALDQMTIVAICLSNRAGDEAWGYSEVQTHGTFANDAPWIRSLADLQTLRSTFVQHWWPLLQGRHIEELAGVRRSQRSPEPAIDDAVRLALWDLQAREARVPLYRLLNPAATSNSRRAYGSLLDFPLSDNEAVNVARVMLDKGITAIKVKVGAPDASRDIERLRLIRSAIGPRATLAADANEAWTLTTALQRLEQFDAAGIHLEYIEDPLPRGDFAGLRELIRRTPVRVIGHDYLNTIEDMQRLVDAGISGIRTTGDLDYMLACVELAKRHHLPVYAGNWQFEVGVQVAAAFDIVDRIEYSALDWNSLVEEPVQISNGLAIAPERPGHGLVLKRAFADSGLAGGERAPMQR